MVIQMKNFGFCTIAVTLMTVIFVSGYSVLRSGEGMAVMTSTRIDASKNSKKITDTTLEPFSKETVTLPKEPGELTADMLDSVVIDGKEYPFPIRIGDLSDDFGYSLISAGVEENVPGIYSGTLTLIYKDCPIATAFFLSDCPGVDEDAIINTITFRSDTNEYFPQIIVGGIDVNNADIREINRIYGYDSDEYGYTGFMADTDDGVYRMLLRESDNCIWQLRYRDNDSENIADEYDRQLSLYTENIYLPKDYSVEEDTANSEMEYIPLPEKNEEFLEIMNSIILVDEPLQLPCTLNVLMNEFGDDAYFDYYQKNCSYFNEYGVYSTSGYIRFGEKQNIYAELLITPGKPIGEAQVKEVAFYANQDFLNGLDIEGENPYGFRPAENKKDAYYLTHLNYNNIEVEDTYFTISYWGENFEEQ